MRGEVHVGPVEKCADLAKTRSDDPLHPSPKGSNGAMVLADRCRAVLRIRTRIRTHAGPSSRRDDVSLAASATNSLISSRTGFLVTCRAVARRHWIPMFPTDPEVPHLSCAITSGAGSSRRSMGVMVNSEVI